MLYFSRKRNSVGVFAGTLPAFFQHYHTEGKAEEGTEEGTDGIGHEVPEVAATAGGAVGLDEFEEATEEGGTDEAEEEQLGEWLVVGLATLAAGHLEPADERPASVHDEVHPLVGQRNLSQLGNFDEGTAT